MKCNLLYIEWKLNLLKKLNSRNDIIFLWKRLHFTHILCAFYLESGIDQEVKRGRASLISATFLVKPIRLSTLCLIAKKSETSRNHESRQTRKRRRAIVCKDIPTTGSLTRLWHIFFFFISSVNRMTQNIFEFSIWQMSMFLTNSKSILEESYKVEAVTWLWLIYNVSNIAFLIKSLIKIM